MVRLKSRWLTTGLLICLAIGCVKVDESGTQVSEVPEASVIATQEESSGTAEDSAEGPALTSDVAEDESPAGGSSASATPDDPISVASAAEPGAPELAVSEVESGSKGTGSNEEDQLASTSAAPADRVSSESGPLTVSEVIERVDDAVVLITIEDAQGRSIGVGSGFVVSDEGLVVTNYHVVRRAVRAHAQLRDGSRIDFESVRSFDKGRDLAVLQLQEVPDELEVIELTGLGDLEQGDRLIAVGHPHGFKFTVTTGIVSAVRATDELPDQFKRFSHWPDDQTWIQTNAAISHGNSGGPLFDEHGSLVGINTWIDPEGQNLGFALHVRHLVDLMDNLPETADPLPVAGSAAARALRNPKVIAIREAFDRDHREYRRKRRSLMGLLSKPKHPAAESIKQLTKLADDDSDVGTQFEALSAACAIAKTDEELEDDLKAILQRLIEEHVSHPCLDNVAIELLSIREEHVFDFQRALLAKSPHRHVRSTACYCLATGLANSPRRRAVQPQVIDYWQQSLENYGDVYLEVYGGGAPTNVGRTAEQVIFRSKHLAVGKSPPNISGEDYAGEPLSLADYRGRVVLLTFSADWNEKCRSLYEDKQRWIEEYADQPFTVLDVSMDTPERIEHLVSEGTISWRLWPDGPKGEIAKAWHIRRVPMALILDRSGVVRGSYWVRGDDLADDIEEAIESALAQPFVDLPDDLLSAGSQSWRYQLAGTEAAEGWQQSEFDDAEWESGAAPLGFGLYDEATTWDFEPSKSDGWTVLLRHSFEVSQVEDIGDLVLSLQCDDGAALYLNGTEVVRQCLADGAAISDSATYDDDRDGRVADLYAIDPKLLVVGTNVIAVELHQAERSSDLRFDLSLSSNVATLLKERLESSDATERLDAIQMLGRLGEAAASAVPALEELLEDDSLRVRVRALEALLLIEPDRTDDELSKPKDKEEKKLRERLNGWLNASSWALGYPRANPAANHKRAWRLINAAYALAPREGSSVNTKGTIEYRLGKYEDAITTLNKALMLQRNNPFDHAVIAMAHHQLGRADKAKQSLSKAEAALKAMDETTEDLTEAKSLVNEAREMIGESEEPDDSPLD